VLLALDLQVLRALSSIRALTRAPRRVFDLVFFGVQLPPTQPHREQVHTAAKHRDHRNGDDQKEERAGFHTVLLPARAAAQHRAGERPASALRFRAAGTRVGAESEFTADRGRDLMPYE